MNQSSQSVIHATVVAGNKINHPRSLSADEPYFRKRARKAHFLVLYWTLTQRTVWYLRPMVFLEEDETVALCDTARTVAVHTSEVHICVYPNKEFDDCNGEQLIISQHWLQPGFPPFVFEELLCPDVQPCYDHFVTVLI